MRLEKQLKNDKYNIFRFIKQVSDLEKNDNIIGFLKQEYEISKINEIMQKGIEYHSMFASPKFNIWLMINRKRLKNSIVFVSVDDWNKVIQKHLNKLRKYAEEIIVECNSKIKIEAVKEYTKSINENIIIGHSNYEDENLRKVILLLGKKFEYQPIEKTLKVLAVIHAYNEEDVLTTTIEYLIKQGVDVYLLDNWSTDNTYKIAKKMQEQYPNKITIERYPEEKPKEESYEWSKQLLKTEEISKRLNYDWYIHYDMDEIRRTPYPNVTIAQMLTFVDSLGYNAIDTTVLDFRLTSKDDDIFAKDGYFELGRRPSCFMQIKAWKKCDDIDLASTGGHLAKFKNQKVYPIKIINRHYPLRNIEQAERKIFRDRLPRFDKERKEKGWHTHYDKIAQNKDFIYEKENLNKYSENIVERLTLEMISGIGIDKI